MQLSALRDKWIAIGLSTAPSDRPRAEAAVKLAYRRAGLPENVRIIWAGSPIAGAAIVDSLVWRANVPRTVATAAQPVTRATSQLLIDELIHARRALVHRVAAQVDERVWKPINRQVARSLKRAIPVPAYGQHDASWLAFYDAAGQDGIDAREAEALFEIAQSCGWWWPFEDVCVLCERHSVLARDERGRLHCTDGPAVLYPDRWSIYAWHGVVVDAWIVLRPELITIAAIERESDPDIKRVLLERYGNGPAEASDTWLRVSGAPPASSQAAAIKPERVSAVFGRQRRGQVHRQHRAES